MKNIIALLLSWQAICAFCPVLSAEPNAPVLPARKTVQEAVRPDANDPNVAQQLRQDWRQNERRQRRQRRQMEFTPEDANQRIALGREYAQQKAGRTRESQLNNEYLKHKRRIAVLNRIKELAAAKNQTEKIQKADSLIQMENQRHVKKILKLQTRQAVTGDKIEKAEPNK